MPKEAEIRQTLLWHFQQYPEMRPQDAVKLIYQNEFGGGHLIADANKSLLRIIDEGRDAADAPRLFEPIGQGLSRIYLRPAFELGIEPVTINRMFVLGAEKIQGNLPSFIQKLAALRDLCQRGTCPFSAGALEAYLADYAHKGYPPVSHSEAYRNAYRPSYRIVREEYARYAPLFAAIDKNLSDKDAVCVGIDGRASSGKTTLARLLQTMYDCNVIHMDDFFLPPELRSKQRLSEPGGNVHYERFTQEVMGPLMRGEHLAYRAFDCHAMAYGDTIGVEPKRLTIVEGSYSLRPDFRQLYDIKVFLDIDAEEQKQRILRRNGEEQYLRFRDLWIPMEENYFSAFEISKRADLVFTTCDQ